MLVKLQKKKEVGQVIKEKRWRLRWRFNLKAMIRSYFHDLSNDTLAACWRRPRQRAGFWDDYSIQLLKKEPNLNCTTSQHFYLSQHKYATHICMTLLGSCWMLHSGGATESRWSPCFASWCGIDTEIDSVRFLYHRVIGRHKSVDDPYIKNFKKDN